MKKILIAGFLVLFGSLLVMAANETYSGVSFNTKSSPCDQRGYVLHSRNTAASLDTFATTISKVYGPYPLSATGEEPMAKGFAVKADVVTGTTPVIAVDYQLISGRSMSDTVSAWTSACTLGTSATSAYFDITSKAGESIVFRVHNYDGTESQIPGLLKIYMKDNVTFYKGR